MATKQVDVKLSVGALMKIKGPLDRGAKQCEQFAKRAGGALKKLEDLKGPIKSIEAYKKLDKEWKDSRKNLDKLRQHQKKLHSELSKGGKVTAKMRAEYERATRAVEKAGRATQRHAQQTLRAKHSLDSMGISVRNIASAENRLQAELKQTESHINRNRTAWERRAESARRAQEKLSKIEQNRDKWGRRALVSGGVLYGTKRLTGAAARQVYSAAEYKAGFTQYKIKGELSGKETEDTKRIVDRVSAKVALDRSQVAEAAFAAIEAGMSNSNIQKSLPSWGRVAKVGGADTRDLVNLTDSHLRNLKIDPKQIEKALAIQYSIGKSGKFEMDSMAKYGAKLASKYEGLKYTGMDAVASQAAAFQVSMNSTNDAAIAANNFSNFFTALGSNETKKRFREKGIDTETEWKGALKYGKDPILHMGKVIREAAKSDKFRLDEMFGDEQARNFAQALMTQIDEYQAYKKAGFEGAGKLDSDLTEVLNDPQAKMDKMAQSWERISGKISGSFLSSMSKLSDTVQPYLDKLEAWMDKNGDALTTMTNVGASVVGATGAVAGLTLAVAGAGLTKALVQGGWIALTQGLDGLIERYTTLENKSKRVSDGILDTGKASKKGARRSIVPSTTVLSRAVPATAAASATAALLAMGAQDRVRAHADPDAWLKKFQGVQPRDEVERAMAWQQSQRIGDGMAPTNEVEKLRQRLKFYREASEEDRAKIRANAQSAVEEMRAASQKLSGEIANSGIPNAMRDQAAKIRSVVFSGPRVIGDSLVDKKRAHGGDFNAGDTLEVGENGREVITMGQSGHVASNAALRSMAGKGQGRSIVQNIYPAAGMDENALASLIIKMLGDAESESYGSSSFA
ncbi:phage tail tape measure protein, TP901 family, core region [Cohaesibacter sp. ES.047]|uniref:phage tail tape measure protein n=1 Tax=Cohaesibacter sp. ES.047 TaxID=1798205 RepID=UPI000BB6DA98|nr:phage tail tape measure protein [Cohaesibacter sp. ES.047]SNY93437.1 phage tail tape measure protein, TP901 family, core region [Cohaesibacter sp. ES.047]